MKVESLELPGLKLITLDLYRDSRGYFTERFHENRFLEFGIQEKFIQDNHSFSLPGVLRGLHFQHTPPQAKLVGVIRGRIWDVVVDLRKGSTFGKFLGTELSSQNGKLLFVPPGFAHGFCVLGDEPADVLYKVTQFYHPTGEAGIRWNDPDLKITWPIQNPNVSERDQELDLFLEHQTKFQGL